MNSDRGMIKWQPFNSVINNKVMINSILKEKEKIRKPELSNEEIEILEDRIIDSYYTHSNILITYYQDGYLLKTIGQIIKIDPIYKKVYLDNHKILLFKQIMEINLN